MAATIRRRNVLHRLNMLLEWPGGSGSGSLRTRTSFSALHVPKVDISKEKARKPYEFGVKASITVTHKKRLMVCAKTFPGNPYNGHILHEQLERWESCRKIQAQH